MDRIDFRATELPRGQCGGVILTFPSEQELIELFDEAWRASELAAACEDRHLVPRLIEMALEIAAWRDRLNQEASTACIPAPKPLRPVAPCVVSNPAPLDEEKWQAARRRYLHDMEAHYARQRAAVSTLQHIGSSGSIEVARKLLQATRDALETARRLAG